MCRERPAAIPIEIRSIDDTSNFDEFPESDILQPGETDFATHAKLLVLSWKYCTGQETVLMICV